jgi:hypothetical protein
LTGLHFLVYIRFLCLVTEPAAVGGMPPLVASSLPRM